MSLRELPVLVFDGDCAFCTNCAHFLERLQPEADIVAWQLTDLAELGITAEQASDAVQWIEVDGTVRSGHEAIAAVLGTGGPIWRTIGRTLTRPGISWLAANAYRLVANNRYRLPGGTPACAIDAEDRNYRAVGVTPYHETVSAILTVQLDEAATIEEVGAVEDVLRSEGFEAEVTASWTKPPQTGNGAFWMVEILVGGSLTAFFSGFAAAAGADAWKKLKSLAVRLRGARAQSKVADSGNIVLKDSTGNQVMLWKDFPDEAYAALFDMDFGHEVSTLLVWDAEAGEWYDPNRRYGGE